jgi:hypothetical protein
MVMSPTFVNAVTMASTDSVNTSATMSNTDKQKRLELITYVKSHLDLIAVTLLVGYLGFALYNEMQKNKS